MAADPRLWFRWNTAMGVASTIASGYREAADRLVADGLGWVDGDVLVPLLPPRLRRHSPLALEEHYRVVRTTLWALERGATPQIDQIATTAAVQRPHVDLALEVLIDDGFIAVKRGRVTPAAAPPRRREPLDREWLVSSPVPTAAKPAPAPAPVQEPKPTPTPVQRPAPAPVPAAAAPQPKPAPTPTPKPEPTNQPTPPPKPEQPEPKTEPEPKQQPPARVTTRTLAAAAAPVSAALTADDDADAGALLRRLVHAAEVSAGLVAAPTRVRTPLGVSPMLDCQLRLCVVLAGSPAPMLRSEISRGWLTHEQARWLDAALADGVRRGAFTETGRRGRAGRGSRYSLADPTVIDGVSWGAIHTAVEAQRAARERRKIGSGAGAAAAS